VFEILTALTVKIVVFLDVMSCSVIDSTKASEESAALRLFLLLLAPSKATATRATFTARNLRQMKLLQMSQMTWPHYRRNYYSLERQMSRLGGHTD
jgi:hypothetical protein